MPLRAVQCKSRADTNLHLVLLKIHKSVVEFLVLGEFGCYLALIMAAADYVGEATTVFSVLCQ